jgi:hypothetical protein
VLGVASLLAGVDVDPDCFHEASSGSTPAFSGSCCVGVSLPSAGFAPTSFALQNASGNSCLLGEIRSCFRISARAGTAVFAVQEVEYGGHDLTSLFDLHNELQAIIFLGAQDVN